MCLGQQRGDPLGVAGQRQALAQLDPIFAEHRRGGVDLVRGVDGQLQAALELGRIERQLAQRSLVGAQLAHRLGDRQAQRSVAAVLVEHVTLPRRH